MALKRPQGPGVPILESYPNGPKDFGFEKWVSVTNFFDLNPIMSRNGNFEEFSGIPLKLSLMRHYHL